MWFLCLDIKRLVALVNTGCYFSSNMGLRSYEHPLQKLKPVPRVDSQGQALGAAFKVDMSHKDKDIMHRVGSEANWAQSI